MFLDKLSKKFGSIPVTAYTDTVSTGLRTGTNGTYRVCYTTTNGMAVTRTVIELKALNDGTNVKVAWEGGGRLQQANNPAGPWTDVPSSPTSPYTAPASAGPQKYYRVVKP